LSAALKPFLRWAGGKRWLTPYLAPMISQILTGRYIEPFLGSGSMFFAVRPASATLGDLNAELIEVYGQVAAHARLIERMLERIPVNERRYYQVRANRPGSPTERAVRFIYLNRTCFGGLHRTNRKGEFNVPYGGGTRTPELVYRDRLLVKSAAALNAADVKLVSGDFANLVHSARAGDVVFCDPTYRAAGRGQFDRYGPIVFSWDDQKRLAAAGMAAYSRGVAVVVMNADVPEVAALYPRARVMRLERTKCIGNLPKNADRHREALLILDPGGHDEVWANLQSKLTDAGLSPRAHKLAGAA